MKNPKYFVNIVYVPVTVMGQKLVFAGGVTQSIPTYSEPFYAASMPELAIAATGSTYPLALTNLLTKVDNNNVYNNGHDPINNDLNAI